MWYKLRDIPDGSGGGYYKELHPSRITQPEPLGWSTLLGSYVGTEVWTRRPLLQVQFQFRATILRRLH